MSGSIRTRSYLEEKALELVAELRLRNRFLLTSALCFLHLILTCLASLMQHQVQPSVLRQIVDFHTAHQLLFCCVNLSGLCAGLMFGLHSDYKAEAIRDTLNEAIRRRQNLF